MQLFKSKEHLNTRESDWIQGAKEGDPRSQKAIYDMLSRKMFAICLRYMGDRESAEDVLQDGFVTLFSKLGSYLGEGSFEGWARKIFVNTALMSLRKNDVLRQTEDVDTAWNITTDAPSGWVSVKPPVSGVMYRVTPGRGVKVLSSSCTSAELMRNRKRRWA